MPQSNISGHINETKPIPVDVLQKIAIRYGVSFDDLTNKDISLEFDSPQTIELKDTLRFGENMFPILTANIEKQMFSEKTARDTLEDVNSERISEKSIKKYLYDENETKEQYAERLENE